VSQTQGGSYSLSTSRRGGPSATSAAPRPSQPLSERADATLLLSLNGKQLLLLCGRFAFAQSE
jgi:hypothetical protein